MRGAERELVAHDRACVSAAEVRAGLADFGRVFAHLRPFEQKQLLRLLLRRAKLGDRELVLEIYGGACAAFTQAPIKANNHAWFAEAPEWLPGSPAQSVLVDTSFIDLPSLSDLRQRSRNRRSTGSAPPLWAARLQLAPESAVTVARRLGVTRAAISLSLARGVGPRVAEPKGCDAPTTTRGRS